MRNVKNNDLLSYEVTDIPDIQLYGEAFGIANLNATHKMRLGSTPDTVIMTPPGGTVHHNTLSYLPPDKYRDEHPKFYMEGEHQLCYTAHGDNAELEVMRELVYQKLISFLQDNLTSPSVEFTQMDVSVWCSCEACNALFQTYGTDAVGQILFINPVAERVQAWIDENQPGRSFTIVLFAYVNTQGAPVKKLADSTYAPIDNSVVCADNVGIFFAPISGDFTRSIEDDVNVAVKEQFTQWSLLTKNLYFWNYVVNFNNYFLPYDSFASIQGMFQRAAQSNTLFIFDQGHYDGQRTSAWSALKVYVHNKLRWDTCANMQELIENFFENYYGIASEEMLGIFNEMRVWLNYLKTEMDWAGGNSCLSSNLSNAEYWPRGVLQGWINEYDKIYEKLEVLKQDGVEEYEKYYYRVGLEAMSPKYMLVTLHTVYLSKDVLEKHVSELEFFIDTLQVDRVAEHKSSNGLREAIIG